MASSAGAGPVPRGALVGSDARRLFIGMQPPPEVLQRLERRVRPTLEGDPGSAPAGVRVMAGADLHLTLVFLGAFPEARRAALEGALSDELRGLDAPELSISGTGGFPDLDRPRVLWLGIDEEQTKAGRLFALYNRTVQAAYSMGWRAPGSRQRQGFRPHVTVARVRSDPRAPLAAHSSFVRLGLDIGWLPAEVCLFESRPDHPEERYRVLASFPLVVRPG